ncbi:tetratricopeptide repeat protein [Allokutzneria sp. A3M-2-11 16]|uniref:AfsR/SARP family transcriptional regulator n=1 Tax=Allokutzneria sp. A3M-2-11 16 TaxID=2962043 RepID=UPI0020B8EB70|nr:AfsR/SARP family transcriptional regulator [Allokutzneria sp. A3M-2-11 16]MCP3804231.1 tetratricopeptide repeat protein [Allokutzneria sp. A3M-2-11 16]
MSTTEMSFRVLGPLEVAAGGRALSLGGAKPRMLLGSLLLNPNRLVSTDLLVEVLWPHSPPRSAVANLRTYVSTLRAGLRGGVDGHGDRKEDRIRALTSGYSLHVEPEELDLLRFDQLVEQAQRDRSTGRPERALELLRQAGSLWRGRPLEGLPSSPGWQSALGRLAERRLAATEERLALQVATGEYTNAIAELQGLLEEHPFREELWRQLMLALHGSGRRAEALHAYTVVRRRLADELGVEPGPELRHVHRLVLSGERAEEPGAVEIEPQHVCQLPPDTPDFTGRTQQLGDLLGTLAEPDRMPIAIVVGAPGMGKTTLATHAAHRLRSRFPDGQLYVDLGGTTRNPRDPATVLAELLRSLGVPGAAVPEGAHERAARFRSLLADRRMLVVLDDAVNAAQVRPLLPATAGSAVLVTSRSRIAELPGAHQVELGVFTPAEAMTLLGSIAGRERVSGDEDACDRLLEACGLLPLAIRIAGAKLAGRQGWPLRVLADRLDDESRRLNELRLGELGVRASVDLSYRGLAPRAARAMRLLGLLEGPSQPGWVVGALLGSEGGTDYDDALDQLVDANLLRLAGVDCSGQPRYAMADLLRVYAREMLRADPVAEREAALERVAGGWLTLAERACAHLPTSIFAPATGAAPRWSPEAAVLRLVTADPVGWLTAETQALVAAVEQGPRGAAQELAACLVPWFDLRSHFDEWRRTHDAALVGAREDRDHWGEAVLRRGLGQLALYQDRYPEAIEQFQRSRGLFDSVGDEHGAAIAVSGLAAVDRVLGRTEEALRNCTAALRMFVNAGDRHGEAYARNVLGVIHLRAGRHAAALGEFSSALRLSRALADRHREAHVLHELGMLHFTLGRTSAAVAETERALGIFEAIGDTQGEVYARQQLGGMHARLGDEPRAAALLRTALEGHRRIGDRRGEASTAQSLGELHQAAGRIDPARTHLALARQLWRELGAEEQAAELTTALATLG